jgi:DNA-directed RNA polymerase specialized sigma24 family protein
MPASDNDPPNSERRQPGTSISIDVLRAYLSRRDTQRRLRNVVAGTLRDQANRALVDDLANDTQMAALTARELAETQESMPAWVDGIARNTVRVYFRELRDLRRRNVPLVDLQAGEDAAEQAEVAAEEDDGRAPVTAPERYVVAVDEAPRWLLARWLRDRTRDEPNERELLDILREHAKTKKSLDQIARERGTTPMAVYQRIQRLRRKYRDGWALYRRRRERMMLVFLLLLGLAIAVALALWRPWRARPLVPVLPVVPMGPLVPVLPVGPLVLPAPLPTDVAAPAPSTRSPPSPADAGRRP